MKKVIEVNGLNKFFKVGNENYHVLKDIDFSITEGEFVSVMGPSGSGKSTLLYLLGGLDTPSSGTIKINNKNINMMKRNEVAKLRRSDIGFIFQFYNLVPNLNVRDNIMLPILLDKKRESDYENMYKELISIIGMDGKERNKPNQLSGGQQQRVAIARSLLYNPKILFADEPIGNLDSKNGTKIMEIFKEINERYNTTIVQVTHSEEAAQYGTRIIKMRDGAILNNSLTSDEKI